MRGPDRHEPAVLRYVIPRLASGLITARETTGPVFEASDGTLWSAPGLNWGEDH